MALYNASVITCQYKTKSCFLKAGPATHCCLLPRPSPVSHADNSGDDAVLDHLPGAFPHRWLFSSPLLRRSVRADEEQAGPGDDLRCTMFAWRFLFPLRSGGPAACSTAFLFCHAAAQLFFKRLRAADVLSPTCAFSLPLMTFFLCKQ